MAVAIRVGPASPPRRRIRADRPCSACPGALVDGNERLDLAGTIAFYGMNGMRLAFTNDEAYDLVIDVASGRLDDVPAIASVLRSGTQGR